MRLGTDIIEIDRIQHVLTKHPQFVERILSVEEQTQFFSYQHPGRRLAYLAGRFAAKEAFIKAIASAEAKRIPFHRLSVINTAEGEPRMVAGPILYPEVVVSISHSRDYAMATVIIEE